MFLATLLSVMITLQLCSTYLKLTHIMQQNLNDSILKPIFSSHTVM